MNADNKEVDRDEFISNLQKWKQKLSQFLWTVAYA
jgi:hypothetical protein